MVRRRKWKNEEGEVVETGGEKGRVGVEVGGMRLLEGGNTGDRRVRWWKREGEKDVWEWRLWYAAARRGEMPTTGGRNPAGGGVRSREEREG
nr:hypothetical protein [Tanacetum cinerariifolium]